jgi:hypothetical protein
MAGHSVLADLSANRGVFLVYEKRPGGLCSEAMAKTCKRFMESRANLPFRRIFPYFLFCSGPNNDTL